MKKSFALVCLFLISAAATARAGDPAPGLKDGRLQPCGSGPHCVSTEDARPARKVEPLAYGRAEGEELRRKLAAYLLVQPRTRVVENSGTYVRYEVKSLLMRFSDDVEVLFDDGSKYIHFRSSSRIGYYDFGVNRRRIAALRRELASASE